MESTERRTLYPPIEPYNTGRLRVSPIHELYFEECGNPKGKPVVFVHGGPGGGTEPKQRRFFDPAAYRIVLFDQRGCGKSTPHACAGGQHHLAPGRGHRALRAHLGIERWQVFGGSWGSTLALAYAETHPERVRSWCCAASSCCASRRSTGSTSTARSALFPDAWEDYLAPIPRRSAATCCTRTTGG